jgi:hypothetical protein
MAQSRRKGPNHGFGCKVSWIEDTLKNMLCGVVGSIFASLCRFIIHVLRFGYKM